MNLAPGLIIAAPASGTGKTTLTLGLIAAFRAEGLVVWVDALDGFPAAAVARERGLAGCGHGEDLFLSSGS